MTMLHKFGVSLLGLILATVAEPVALPAPSPAPSPAPVAKTQAAAALNGLSPEEVANFTQTISDDVSPTPSADKQGAALLGTSPEDAATFNQTNTGDVGQTTMAKDPLAAVFQQEGDGAGQTTSAKDPLAAVFQQEGDGVGQTTMAKDPLAAVFQQEGDGVGQTTVAKDSLSAVFQQEGDGVGQTPSAKDPLAAVFQQEGDGVGQTTSAKDPLAGLFQQDGEGAAASGGATTTAKDPLAGLFQQEAAEDPLAAVMDLGSSTPSAQEERKLERDSTTPIAESITDDHCFEDDASWAPLDMQNQGMTSENDAVACQHRCLSVPGCMHFSFLNATKSCHLQDAFAFHKPNSLGFLSGPFSCQGIRPGQKGYVKIGDRTYLPRELGCLELGTTYAPDLGTLSIFSPEQDTDHGIMGMNSIRNCQRQCNVTQGCKYFTVQFPAGYCKLAGASAKPLANMEGAVSGPRIGCNAASALATGGLGAIMVKDTVGIPSVDRVGGIGTPAVLVLLVLASITAVAFRFQRGIYERLREQQDSPDDSCEGEPNQAPLLV